MVIKMAEPEGPQEGFQVRWFASVRSRAVRPGGLRPLGAGPNGVQAPAPTRLAPQYLRITCRGNRKDNSFQVPGVSRTKGPGNASFAQTLPKRHPYNEELRWSCDPGRLGIALPDTLQPCDVLQ